MNSNSHLPDQAKRSTSLPKKYLWPLLAAWVALILLVTSFQQLRMNVDWRQVPGYEFEWVAESIAGGHGYSFPGTHRWLFPETNDTNYYPTAWTEPVYSLFMAFCFKFLQEFGRPAILLSQSLSIALTSITILFLAWQVFDLWTGLLASLFLLLIPAVPFLNQASLSNSAFAGLLVSLSAFLILNDLWKVSIWRSLLLGLFLGFATLAHSAIAMFIPIAMLVTLTSRHPIRIEKWIAALVIPIVSIAVIFPWMVRNLLTFDTLVPMRDGFGFNAYIGNPTLVETYQPTVQACPYGTTPAFKTSSPWEAMKLTLVSENQRALYARAYQCIGQDAPQDYAQLNEAQRDRLYMKKVISFISSEPIQWIRVTFYKICLFFSSRFSLLIISLLAFIGAVISIRNPQARILGLLILSFAAPFILAIPFYYRYRYPVEPLIVILASYTLWTGIKVGGRLAGKVVHFRAVFFIPKRRNGNPG